MLQRHGGYALVAGLAVAVVVGLVPKLDSNPVQVILVVLGLLGGALNVRNERAADFLMAAIALMLAANMRGELAKLTTVGDAIEHILRNVYIVTAAASLVLAVKVILSTAMDRKKT